MVFARLNFLFIILVDIESELNPELINCFVAISNDGVMFFITAWLNSFDEISEVIFGSTCSSPQITISSSTS